MTTAKSRNTLYSTEYVVDAQCVSTKTVDTYFRVYAAGFPASYFQITNSRYPFTGANEVKESRWYKITLRFFKNDQPCVPRANVTSSRPMETPAGGPAEWRHNTAYTEHMASTKVTGLSCQARQRDPLPGSETVPSNEPVKSLPQLDDIGVVCCVEESLYYVYSMINEGEAVVRDPRHSIELGNWIKFNVSREENDLMLVDVFEKTEPKFPTIPIRDSVVVECKINTRTYDAENRTVSSNFVYEVRDDFGLVEAETRRVCEANITYAFKEEERRRYWQLCFIH
ncbi:hypothetical protein AAVH_05241 [Aphelenchoides avenae]|nr:hypothetical protein AAVH_05241 [Aphelenchus avenae]